jgi:lipopolysaccharide exporter
MQHPESSKSSSFTNDVLLLVSGTTLAQFITVLASPILTRLYGPEAFGLLMLFTSITSIIGVIVCMSYELTIMLPKTNEEAANLLGLSLFFVIVVSGLTVPAVYFGGEVLLAFIRAPDLGPYLILIPPFVFISGVFLALNYWNSRTRHFGRLSVAQITSSLFTTGTQLGAGVAGYATGGGLIGANFVGVSVSTGVLGGQIWRDDHALLRKSISLSGMLNGLRRYKKFPLIDSGTSLLNTISWQLPAFLLSAFFSPVIVGFYALGMRVIQLPMNLIGGAIAQVFFQRAAEVYHHGSLVSITENVFEMLLKLSVFPMLVIAVAGQDLFLVVFGAAWGEAGVYAQILSIWAIFWFISSPLSTILTVRENLQLGFNMTLINFSTRLLSLIIGGMMGSAVMALALFSISGTFVYGFACFVFLKLAGVPWMKTLRMITKSLALSVPFLIPVIGVKILAFPTIIVVIVAFLAFIAYGIYVSLTDPILRNFVTGMIIKYFNKT